MTCILSRLLPAISPLLFTALCTVACAAQQARADAKPVGTPAAAKVEAKQLPDAHSAAEVGLPTFLLKVPTGSVWLGLTPEQLVEMAVQSANPADPTAGAKDAVKVERNLRQTATALGHTRENIDEFLLGKWPITNKEYEVFVKKTGHRFPYHWWRYGCPDDYGKRIEAMQREFPKDKQAAVDYWKAHWQNEKLPYVLKDDHGKSIEDKPVTYISYRDATAFAGWLGMRLPSEKELTRAAKADADIIWPWGDKKDGPGDQMTVKALELVQLKEMKDQHLKSVGAVQFVAGPFGHLDMTGQVWVFSSDLDFEPLCAKKEFDAAIKDLKKLKLGKLLQTVDAYKPGKAVLKGGSFLSGGDPIQLSADSRVSMDTEDVVETVGLRLAKTLRPGYDMLYSLIRSGYKQDMWVPGQELALTDQVGMERYELDAGGFPEAYQAISFAPVNFITNAKNANLKSIAEHSQVHPVPIGTLAVSVPLLVPAITEPGIFTVYYRNKGMPRELTDALKAGHKEVQAALKKKPAADPKAEPEAQDPAKEKKDDWRGVLSRYGLGEKDLEPKDALEKLKSIRIGELQVSTEENQLLFYGNDGLAKAALPLRFDQLTAAAATPSTLEVGEAKLKDGARLQVKLHFGVQLEEKVKNRMADFIATLVLDMPPVSDDKPWRLPPAAK